LSSAFIVVGEIACDAPEAALEDTGEVRLFVFSPFALLISNGEAFAFFDLVAESSVCVSDEIRSIAVVAAAPARNTMFDPHIPKVVRRCFANGVPET
jgi:hypothetical protein